MPFDHHPRTTRESPRPRPARGPIAAAGGVNRPACISQTLVSGISRPRSTKTNSREKLFREKRGIPLDREAKVRIMAYARGYNAKHRREGQHQGPITWAFFRVLKALLWEFHNAKTGYCFPGYEAIAEKARCHRDTVYEAIRVLEESGILDWVHRFEKIFIQGSWQVIRTSNAYLFRDPLPCGNTFENRNKSENPAGTLHPQEKILKVPPKGSILTLENSMIEVLIGLGRSIGAIPA